MLVGETWPSTIFRQGVDSTSVEVFQPHCAGRMLLFEHPYVFGRAHFDALCDVAARRGAKVLDARTIESKGSNHAHRFALGDWTSYDKALFGLENIVYSGTGSWGCLFTAFGHVVIGGAGTFTADFRAELIARGLLPSVDDPPESEDVIGFLRQVANERAEGPRGWPGGLVAHLYGDDLANHFFACAKIREDA
jgi:hypothetical protein